MAELDLSHLFGHSLKNFICDEIVSPHLQNVKAVNVLTLYGQDSGGDNKEKEEQKTRHGRAGQMKTAANLLLLRTSSSL